jgi:predicted ATPase
MLLLLDNLEHLLDGLDLVTEILQKAPDLKIMVTSRVTLNLEGEQLMTVEGMRTPDPTAGEAAAENEAVKLFLQRARGTRLGPDWAPSPEEIPDVIRICRLVEGMPLGILLAAAWIEMLSPAEIAAEIGRGLGILSSDQRDLPERQRSIRAVFDHSWSLLTETERDQFQQLCVFQGSFSRAAARAVAGASLFDLRALLGKSLLESAPAGRWEIHTLLQQYGLKALDRSPDGGRAARDRHSAYFAASLAGWEADLKGAQQQGAMAEIEADLDNVRAAWGWAAEHGPLERIEMAVDGLGLFYQYASLLQEGEAAFKATERFLKGSPSPDGRRLWAKMLALQATMRWFSRDWDLTRELLQQSNAILESPELADHDVRQEKAMTLFGMGYSAEHMMEKERLLQESLTISRELGDDWRVATASLGMARAARRMGDYARAGQLIEESLAIQQRLGNPREIADALNFQGRLALFQGQYERGERLLREAISARERLGQRLWVATSRATLGIAFTAQGRFQQGVSLLRESVRALEDIGGEEPEHWWRIWLADCLAEQGTYQAALREAEKALRFYQGSGRPWGTAQALFVMARAALGTGHHAEARQRLEEASAKLRGVGNRETLALTLIYQAYPAVSLGDLAAAEKVLAEGLALASQVGWHKALVSGVPALALLRAHQGRLERAVELYAVALSDPQVRASRWFDDVVGSEIAAATAPLPPAVAAAARARGQERDIKAAVGEFVGEQED